MLHEAPDWLDTGYDTDKVPCAAFLSEIIVDYEMRSPWVDGRVIKKMRKMHRAYLRVANEPTAELHKFHLPLFIIVLMACVCFLLEPDSTNERAGVAITAMIGVVQTKQTMERYNVATLLDKYSNLCLGIILLVLYESMWIKQRLNGSRWGFDAAALMVDIKVNRSSPDFVAAEQVDTGATVVTGLWMLPNLALYWPWMRKRVMFRAFGLNRTWDDVLDFLDHESTTQAHNSQDKDPDERKMSRHQSKGGVLVNENKDGQPEGLENRQLARPQSRGDHSGGRFESPEP
eukprot:COSAG04_NODE_4049_length_2338_cov_10.713711_2_plen_288_part_00